MKPSDFETLARTLVGATLARVRYYDLVWGQDAAGNRPEPDWWDAAAGGHRSMYGFDMITADSATHAVVAESTWPFGLSIQQQPLEESKPHAQAWDVSHLSQWTGLIGARIIAVDVVPGTEITPEGYRRLNDQYFARRWWLRLLWPWVRGWWQPVTAVDWESLGPDEKISVTCSVRIVTEGGQFVEAQNYSADVLITFGTA